MSIGRDGIAGLILLAVSLVLLVQSFQLPKLPIVPVGPGFYPAIVLSFLAAASALLVVQDLMRSRAKAADGEAAPRWNYWPVVKAFAIVGGYIALMPLLGFRLSTVLFVTSLQAALDRAARCARMGGARRDRNRHRSRGLSGVRALLAGAAAARVVDGLLDAGPARPRPHHYRAVEIPAAADRRHVPSAWSAARFPASPSR